MNMFVFANVIPQGTIMEEMDFERRRELRRQKREEMRLEAERSDSLPQISCLGWQRVNSHLSAVDALGLAAAFGLRPTGATPAKLREHLAPLCGRAFHEEEQAGVNGLL